MYVTMSHWEASEMTDEMIETMQTKFMPMIRSLGAEQCFEVQTSDTTVTIVTVYPDEKTKAAASEINSRNTFSGCRHIQRQFS